MQPLSRTASASASQFGVWHCSRTAPDRRLMVALGRLCQDAKLLLSGCGSAQTTPAATTSYSFCGSPERRVVVESFKPRHDILDTCLHYRWQTESVERHMAAVVAQETRLEIQGSQMLQSLHESLSAS